MDDLSTELNFKNLSIFSVIRYENYMNKNGHKLSFGKQIFPPVAFSRTGGSVDLHATTFNWEISVYQNSQSDNLSKTQFHENYMKPKPLLSLV